MIPAIEAVAAGDIGEEARKIGGAIGETDDFLAVLAVQGAPQGGTQGETEAARRLCRIAAIDDRRQRQALDDPDRRIRRFELRLQEFLKRRFGLTANPLYFVALRGPIDAFGAPHAQLQSAQMQS
jgi:hypothetical protein